MVQEKPKILRGNFRTGIRALVNSGRKAFASLAECFCLNPEAEVDLHRRASIKALLGLSAAGLLGCREKRFENPYHLVDPRFIEALEKGATIKNAPPFEMDVLENVEFCMDPNYRDPRTHLTISEFLYPNYIGQNPGHEQKAVESWIKDNDSFADSLYPGLQTDEDLKRKIDELKQGSEPKIINLIEHPHLTIYVEHHSGPGVEQKWRRVIRADHIPIMDELNLRINQFLREHGMPEKYFVTVMINSTVRSIEHNGRLEESSTTSTHLVFSGIDLSEKFYLIHQFEGDGVITRARDEDFEKRYKQLNQSEGELSGEDRKSLGSLKKFRDALDRVVYQMALEGKLFVRFHNKHFHIVPKVEVKDRTRKSTLHPQN